MFDIASKETYEDGQVILEEGSTGNWMYVVLSGKVEISKKDRMNMEVKLDTKCQMVNKLGELIGEVNLREALKPHGGNIIYEKAAGTIGHAACPVPMAVLKAIEVEAGMALPRPVNLTFEIDK